MTTQYGLSSAIIADFTRLFSQCDWIEKVLLFGSRAKGNYRAGSDIDLAVFGSPTQAQITHLWAEIDSLPLVFKVDLVFICELENTQLFQKISQEGIKLYPSPS